MAQLELAIWISDRNKPILDKAMKESAQVRFSEFDANVSGRFYIEGIVRKKCQTTNFRSQKQIKLFLVEKTTDSQKLTVYIRGQFYEPIRNIEEEDTIWLFNPRVGLAPRGAPDEHSCVAFMTETADHRCLFVAKRAAKTAEGPAPGKEKHKEVGQQQKKLKEPRIYTPLNDLKADKIVNIYGVVSYFRPPCPTRGTGMSSFVKIVDSTDLDGLRCSLFHSDEKMLPQIREIGDIIRIHRLKIQTYQGNLQGALGPGASCVVVSGNLGQPIKPRTGNSTVTFDEDDKGKVEDLRLWASLNLSELETCSRKTLSTVQPGIFFNFVCQVIGISVIHPNDCVVLRVLDGTKPQLKLKLTDVPLQTFDTDLVSYATSEELFVDVFCYESHAAAALKIEPGAYVLFCNCHAWSFSHHSLDADEVVEICMHKGTSHGRGITHLGVDDDPELKNIERRICLGMEDFVPAMKSKLIINIDPDKLPLTKVEDILKDPKVPNVYHIQAAVLSYFPNEIKSMVILLCSACNASYEPGAASFCSLCPGSDTQTPVKLDYVFMLKLKLRDLTEEMDAILFKEDALTFFNGTNPGSVVVSSEAEEELQSTLDSLCSHACHPVLDCIIKSYHHTKTNKAMYRITATQLTV